MESRFGQVLCFMVFQSGPSFLFEAQGRRATKIASFFPLYSLYSLYSFCAFPFSQRTCPPSRRRSRALRAGPAPCSSSLCPALDVQRGERVVLRRGGWTSCGTSRTRPAPALHSLHASHALHTARCPASFQDAELQQWEAEQAAKELLELRDRPGRC